MRFSTLFVALGLLTMPAVSAAQEETATAVFAGGCFWCVEADFDKVEGVTGTVSGYIGGDTENPTYENHSATGHREAVKITFDPSVTDYWTLLDTFWRTIDPTDDGGQFCDRAFAGRGRRSARKGDRYGDRRRRDFLACRGLPPGLLQQERGALQFLPRRLRPRRRSLRTPAGPPPSFR